MLSLLSLPLAGMLRSVEGQVNNVNLYFILGCCVCMHISLYLFNLIIIIVDFGL